MQDLFIIRVSVTCTILELSARNIGIDGIPVFVTDSAPTILVANLDSAFIGLVASN